MTPPLPEIPVSDEPSPTNFCAVTIPTNVACPFDSTVTPVPTAIELPTDTLLAKVVTPATLTLSKFV